MDSLNAVCSGYKKCEKILNLKVGLDYRILSGKIIQSRYGKAVILNLEDFSVFLPKRYASEITDEHLKNFNTGEYTVTVKEHFKVMDKETVVLTFQKL